MNNLTLPCKIKAVLACLLLAQPPLISAAENFMSKKPENSALSSDGSKNLTLAPPKTEAEYRQRVLALGNNQITETKKRRAELLRIARKQQTSSPTTAPKFDVNTSKWVALPPTSARPQETTKPLPELPTFAIAHGMVADGPREQQTPPNQKISAETWSPDTKSRLQLKKNTPPTVISPRNARLKPSKPIAKECPENLLAGRPARQQAIMKTLWGKLAPEDVLIPII